MSTQLVTFRIGGEEYALPVGAVREVIRFTGLRSLPTDSPSVRGVIHLRDRSIPVCTLDELGEQTHEGAKVIVIEVGELVFGVLVDQVEEVIEIEHDGLEAPPPQTADIATAIAKLGDRLIILIEPSALPLAG
jgi:purine-binding chemotaxis protein CheW